MQANIDPRTHTVLSWYHSRSFWIIFHGPGTRSGSIKGDHSLSVLFQFWSLPKAAPWTETRVFRHLPHSQVTYLLVALPCLATPTGRHTQKLHFPSNLIYCKFRRRVSTWNQGFLWPSLLDLGTLMDSLPPAPGSEQDAPWHCHLSAYTRTA